jgi:hypothetical protein
MKFKMAGTAGFNLTLDTMGKCFKTLLLWNHLDNSNQTDQEWSLEGPLQHFCHLLWYFPSAAIKSLIPAKRKLIVFSNFESCKILLLTENVEILNNLSLLKVWQKMHRFQSTGVTFCHRKCYSEFTHQKQIKTFEARADGQEADVESLKQEHGVTCSDSMARRRPNTRVEDL